MISHRFPLFNFHKVTAKLKVPGWKSFYDMESKTNKDTRISGQIGELRSTWGGEDSAGHDV